MAKKRTTKQRQPSTDAFTLLVRSQLHVECVKEYRFHPVRRWRFDYAIPSHKIAVEVEGGVWTGGRHIRPQGFLGDVDKYNSAAVMGWKVLRVTPGSLMTNKTLNLLKNVIFMQ